MVQVHKVEKLQSYPCRK